jgi:hypothetical protein
VASAGVAGEVSSEATDRGRVTRSLLLAEPVLPLRYCGVTDASERVVLELSLRSLASSSGRVARDEVEARSECSDVWRGLSSDLCGRKGPFGDENPDPLGEEATVSLPGVGRDEGRVICNGLVVG